MAFDKALDLLSPLGSGKVQCYQTERNPWRKVVHYINTISIILIKHSTCQNWEFLADLENNLANSRRATTPLPLSSDPNERL